MAQIYATSLKVVKIARQTKQILGNGKTYYAVLFRGPNSATILGDLMLACVFDEPGFVSIMPADCRYPMNVKDNYAAGAYYEPILRKSIAEWEASQSTMTEDTK